VAARFTVRAGPVTSAGAWIAPRRSPVRVRLTALARGSERLLRPQPEYVGTDRPQCGVTPWCGVDESATKHQTVRVRGERRCMPSRSDRELIAFSEHLLYDVQLFFHESRALTRTRLELMPSLPWEVEMALVESFAMHARALVDFFFREKGRSDDAFASHFFSHRTWEKLRLSQGPWISEVRQPALDRFGKEIAHLNYHRVTLAEQARGWPVVQIAGAIGEVLWVFGANVDQSRVMTDFKVRAEREIPAFARLGSWPGAIAPVWPRASATQTLSTRAGEAG
jgi:hypothetical protein